MNRIERFFKQYPQLAKEQATKWRDSYEPPEQLHFSEMTYCRGHIFPAKDECPNCVIDEYNKHCPHYVKARVWAIPVGDGE